MAVTSIVENWEARKVEESTEARTAVRVFNVVFDEQDDPVARPILALRATTTTLTVPQHGEQHPYDSALFCIKRSVEQADGPLVYDVTCNYSTVTYESSKEKNPLKQKPEISWTFVTTDEQIDCDVKGNPITNSSGESFDPPVTDERHVLALKYISNEKNFDPKEASKYIGSVNSGSFMGFKEGQVKCATFDGELIRDDEHGDYYRITKELHFRRKKIKGKEYGWEKRILDQGYYQKSSTGAVTPIMDDQDEPQPITQPKKLDGNGQPLDMSGTVKGVFLIYETREKKPFSSLKIKV